MGGWYYTLIFVFTILVIGRALVKFSFTLFSTTSNRFELVDNERILYAISMSYLITYLIYI
jgi:hypothetical protein